MLPAACCLLPAAGWSFPWVIPVVKCDRGGDLQSQVVCSSHFQGCKIPRLQGPKAPRPQGSRVPGFQGFRGPVPPQYAAGRARIAEWAQRRVNRERGCSGGEAVCAGLALAVCVASHFPVREGLPVASGRDFPVLPACGACVG